jgi:hypothetical protein
MTAPIPTAELIGEHRHSGRHTARVLCVYCGRNHQHLWPADLTAPLAAPCGQGHYTIGRSPT